MPTAAQSWIRDHRRGENKLAQVLRRFFDQQTKRIVRYVASLDKPTSVDDVAFDVGQENEKLLAALMAPMAGIAAAGAVRVLRQGRRQTRGRKDVDIEAAVASELEKFDIPEHVRKAIQKALDALAKESYWADIQRTTSENLAQILREGVEAGDSGPELAKKINKALGGQAKWRAKAIARTETTGLFGAGHDAVFQTLAEDDLIVGKQWLAIVDDRTRASHLKLNNKIVKPTEDFNVGGSKAPYPGHASLPAQERIHCRCVAISVFKDE